MTSFFAAPRYGVLRNGCISFLATFALGGAGGAVFAWLGIPLPWMLGSLFATSIYAITAGRWKMPPFARSVARPVVGILAGSAFTPLVAASILAWWPVILFVALYTLAVTSAGFVYFRRIALLDRVTALFASTPAGLSELSLLGGTLGADIRSLVIIHSVRVLTVVIALPLILQFILGHPVGRSIAGLSHPGAITGTEWLIMGGIGLAGFLIGTFGRFPGGSMVAALFLSAVLHGTGLLEAAPPGWLVIIVQIVVGAVLGGRFGGIQWRNAGRIVLLAVLWSALLLLLFSAVATVGAWLFERPVPALLLALAPGGMLEVTVMTYALGVEVAFVMTCQVCRSLLVLGVAPAILKPIAQRSYPPKSTTKK